MKNTAHFQHEQDQLVAVVGVAIKECLAAEMSTGRGLMCIARAAGMTREGVLRCSSARQNITLRQMARLAGAMGLKVSVTFAATRQRMEKRAMDIRSEPMRSETSTIHGLIASVELPRLAKPNGQHFKHATIRSVLHGVARNDWNWTSMPNLAPMCGTTPTTLVPMLAALCRAGLLEREDRPKLGLGRGLSTCRYRVCEHKLRMLIEPARGRKEAV